LLLLVVRLAVGVLSSQVSGRFMGIFDMLSWGFDCRFGQGGG